MKKLIIACLLIAFALLSLSACSSTSGKSEPFVPGTVDSGPRALVPSPGSATTTTDPDMLQTATPNLRGPR